MPGSYVPITNQTWKLVQPIVEQGPKGAPRQHDSRSLVGLLLFRKLCHVSWRGLKPVCKDVGIPWGTLYAQFNRWRENGVWARVLEATEAPMIYEDLPGAVVRALPACRFRSAHVNSGESPLCLTVEHNDGGRSSWALSPTGWQQMSGKLSAAV